MNNGKTVAILSYFWWIGLLIAFIMNNQKRTYLGTFHIRQAMGLSLLSFAIGLIAKYVNGSIASILFMGLFILWVIGLLSAIKKEEKPVPLVGEKFQELFKTL